ncbi:MAG: response regulator [Holosporales bacterium]|jgi:two-component system cell cycle sensor histidine kinase/response regulator CckA|nr:response regulator [Holosporales bacterium]
MSSRYGLLSILFSKKHLPLFLLVTSILVLFLLFEGPLAIILFGLFSGGGLYGLVRSWRRAEQKARVWEERCTSAEAYCQLLPYGVLVFDDEGHCHFSNTLTRQLFPGGAITSFSDLLAHFSEYPKMQETLRLFWEKTEDKHQQYLDIPLSKKDKTLAWWRITAAPLPSSPGWTMWSFADLTPAARISEFPEASPVFLLELLHSSTVGYFTIDTTETVVFCNAIFAHWLGRKRTEILGMPVQKLFTEDFPPSLPTAEGADRFAPASFFPMTIKSETTSLPVKVQHIFDREAWHTYSVWAEEKITPSEPVKTEKLSAFIQSMAQSPLGVLTLDENFTLTACNTAIEKLLGQAVQSLIGRNLWAFVEEKNQVAFQNFLREATSSFEKPFETELLGEERRAVLIYGENFEHSFVLYLADITSRKRVENQILQSQKIQAVGQLAGSIAHDFNNLLTAMIGYCDLLLGRYSPAEQSFADVMQIKQNANRASHLVQQLLAFSRRQTLQPEVIDVADTLSDLSALLQRLLGERVDLQILYGSSLGLVRADPIQLEQVIINLCVNARDAMPDGGTLLLKISATKTTIPTTVHGEVMPPGTYTLIEVQDTGMGIPPEDLPYIFDPFYSTKPLGAGTGLGLATVHGIIKQTGGFIDISSLCGKGTTFRVFLPIYENASAISSRSSPPPLAEKPKDLTGSGHILLVEDEEAVRLFSARALRDKGYTVTEAENGHEALTYFQDHPEEKIDLLITDVIMPKMDGPTLMKEIRAKHPHLKGIFISGYTEDRLLQGTEEVAGIAFLQKPFDLKQLAEKVRSMLQGEIQRELIF